MTAEIMIVLGLLGVAIALMVTELLRADLVAWLLAISLALVGIVTTEDVFSGFSRSAVVTILAVFILTTGLNRTGVTRRVGWALHKLAGDRPRNLLSFTMLSGALLALFMNNIAAVAVLLPAVMDVCRRSRTSPSKLLIPLVYGIQVGGMTTLLTTANIIISAVLRDQGLEPFGLLDFLSVGLPIVAVGIAYMVFFGHRLLPTASLVDQLDQDRVPENSLDEAYQLEERLSEVRVLEGSPLAGTSMAASEIGARLGLNVLTICRRDGITCAVPTAEWTIEAGDTMLLSGRPERVREMTDLGVEVVKPSRWNESLTATQAGLMEVILSPRSQAAGITLKELAFREKYGLSVVALWRKGRNYRTDVGDIPLQFGDALLVHGPRERISVLRADPDFLVLSEPDIPVPRHRGWLAATIMAVALAAAAFNLLPIGEATMLGALMMVVTGCLTMDEAYRGIEWRAIFSIAGMLPAGIALNQSGAADWLGQLLITGLAGWGPMALVGGIFLLAVLLTQVMSGQVAAIVVAPLAIASAEQAGINPHSVAMATALGCSIAFLTPTAHPVNVFIMGPGGYRFRDFFRVGLPMTVLVFLTAMLVLPLFWPLQ